MNKQQIIQDIFNHIKNGGGFPNEWYVGIANDAEGRLFSDHNVDRQTATWIWRPAESSEEAREIEQYFLNAVRTDGGQGGGDRTSKQVYAYKKTWQTRP